MSKSLETVLVIVSGSDRVGKTTFIDWLVECFTLSGYSATKQHFSAPSNEASSIFSMYKNALASLDNSYDFIFWDRSYVCGHILERSRRNTHCHLSDVVDFELYLLETFQAVLHLGIVRPWFWSAPKIIDELKENQPNAAKWWIRDELIKARNEHLFYQEALVEFYEELTIFPSSIIDNTDVILPSDILELIDELCTK